MRKRLSIVFALLIIGCVGYFASLLFFSYEVSNQNKLNTIITRAITEKNPSVCGKVWKFFDWSGPEGDRTSCYLEYAKKYPDDNMCSQILNKVTFAKDERYNECRLIQAVGVKDPQRCLQLGDYYLIRDCMENMAFEYRDVGICDAFSDANKIKKCKVGYEIDLKLAEQRGE